jgi:hypothetical protein
MPGETGAARQVDNRLVPVDDGHRSLVFITKRLLPEDVFHSQISGEVPPPITTTCFIIDEL